MESQYTSLELSKKLKEAGFEKETEYCWINVSGYIGDKGSGNTSLGSKYMLELYEESDKVKVKSYPAYDFLWDICIKYKEEFWGQEPEDNDYDVP